MPKTTFMGQIVLGETTLPRHPMLPGKQYFWMQDGDGTVYLLPKGEDGMPRFA